MVKTWSQQSRVRLPLTYPSTLRCILFRISFRHSLYLTFPSDVIRVTSLGCFSFRIRFFHALWNSYSHVMSRGCFSFRIHFRHLYLTFLSTSLGCYLSESVSCGLATLQGCLLFRIRFPSLFWPLICDVTRLLVFQNPNPQLFWIHILMGRH